MRRALHQGDHARLSEDVDSFHKFLAPALFDCLRERACAF
jgi:hypothetical protein